MPMIIRKRMTAALAGVLMLLMLLPVQVLAEGDIDLNQDVSLTLSCHDGETPLTGAESDIYLAATVDEYGELTPTEDFKQFDVNIRGENDDAWRELASTMEGYVLKNGIAPTDSGETDKQGILEFPCNQKKLQPGLYLVLGQSHTQGGRVYEASPFLVMLPGRDQETGEWIYDVTAEPKLDSEPVPEVPGTVTRKVLKVWKDEGHEKERPQEITVQLLQDGRVFDTVTLNADSNWRHTWTDLDRDHKWTVVENEVENYTAAVTREGITFVVTNTYDEDVPDESEPSETEPSESEPSESEPPVPPSNPGKPTRPNLPNTGQLWWPVPVLLAGGFLLIVVGVIRRRGTGHEE